MTASSHGYSASLHENIVLILNFLAVVLELAVLLIFSRLDNLVHGDLYNYGLSFSSAWAFDYWNSQAIVIDSLIFSLVLTAITLVPFYIYSNERSVSSRWSCILCPIIAAGVASVAMYFVYHIESIVNVTLYQYGLQFNPEWAVGYWNIVRATLELGGIAIAALMFMALVIWFVTRTRD